jgi:quercetin dioxygenase-like cupin family protein
MTGQTKLHYTADEDVSSDLFEGGRIQFIHTDRMTFAAWTFAPGTVVPAHVHPHQQITHCISGLLRIHLDGEDVELRPGESAVIPGGVEHAASADVETHGVDVFHPVREDYKALQEKRI